MNNFLNHDGHKGAQRFLFFATIFSNFGVFRCWLCGERLFSKVAEKQKKSVLVKQRL